MRALALLSAALVFSCSVQDGSADLPPGPFCEALDSLGAGAIDVGSDDPNEFVGHVASLDVLLEVAPKAVHDDLSFVREMMATTRDVGGWRTLFDFAALQSTELVAAEGRVSDYISEQCSISYDEPAWNVDESEVPEPRCPAWPRVGSPLVNNRFPYLIATAAANYFSSTFWSVPFVPAPPGFIDVPRGGSVVFEAEYPFTRYFAYHPNDYELNNLDTLVDHALDPDSGSANPWREAVEAGTGRRYTARLVFDAPPGGLEDRAANTSYVGRTPDGRFNPAVFLILRIYAADQGALPPNSAGVLLPAVTVLDEDGEEVAHYEPCDPYPPGSAPPVDDTRFPAFQVPDHRSVFSPGVFNTSPNWGLPVSVMANADVTYLGAPYSREVGEVFVVRARKPRTPSRRDGVVLHSGDIDIRLWTVCTYNFWHGRAMDCVTDEDIAVDASGEYVLLASDREHRPANATHEKGVTWLDTGRFRDGQLTFRMLLASDDLLLQIAEAIDSGEIDAAAEPFVPRSAFCSVAAFEAGGADGCFAGWERDPRNPATRTTESGPAF